MINMLNFRAKTIFKRNKRHHFQAEMMTIDKEGIMKKE